MKIQPGKKLKNGATALDYDPASGTVLAFWDKHAAPYVTWKADKEGNTYWGHYFTSMAKAAIDFEKRSGRKANPVKLSKKTATSVRPKSGGGTAVRYHQTDVVSIMPNGNIILDSGGWKTATTKRRMNEAAKEFELYYNVFQKKGDWYVTDVNGKTHEFFDGIEIDGPRHLQRNPKRKRKVAKKRRTAKQRAATRKLIAYNKKRRKKKTKTARRKTRRNPARKKRTASKKSHLWMVFACRGKTVRFLSANAKGKFAFIPSSKRAHALLWKTKGDAFRQGIRAERMLPKGYYTGVVSDDVTVAQLRAHCDSQGKR